MSRDVYSPPKPLPDVYEPPPEGHPPPRRHHDPQPTNTQLGLSLEAWKSLAIGSVIGVVVFALPFARFVFSYLNTLAHELGHSVAAWGFGYPALPAFDWRYGGGLTVTGSRSTMVMLMVFAVWAFLIYQLRDRPGPRNGAIVCAVIYSVIAFSPAQEVIRLAMGHTMELIIAGIFFYRALSGQAITHDVERPLYAACCLFILLQNLKLSWGLMFDIDARTAYGMAKGGGHWMDLSQIARDYLSVSLPTVAAALFLGCLLTPPITFLIFRRLQASDSS